MQTTVLARLFQLVEAGQVQAPLFNPAHVANPAITNAQFLQEYVTSLLMNAFPHLLKYVVSSFVVYS